MANFGYHVEGIACYVYDTQQPEAGTDGRGSAPNPRAITCWSAAISRPVNWPFTTATCPKGRY